MATKTSKSRRAAVERELARLVEECEGRIALDQAFLRRLRALKATDYPTIKDLMGKGYTPALFNAQVEVEGLGSTKAVSA